MDGTGDAPSALPTGGRRTEGERFVVVTEVQRGILQNMMGAVSSSKIVILQADGSGFSERVASPKSDFSTAAWICCRRKDCDGGGSSLP